MRKLPNVTHADYEAAKIFLMSITIPTVMLFVYFGIGKDAFKTLMQNMLILSMVAVLFFIASMTLYSIYAICIFNYRKMKENKNEQ